jgi:hypothetical protein
MNEPETKASKWVRNGSETTVTDVIGRFPVCH